MLNLFLRIITILFIALGYFEIINPIVSTGIFVVLVLLFGIPHGSIDHLVNSNEPNLKFSEISKKFYLEYFIYFIVVVIGWIIAPVLCFALFIFLSGYHFGQSQLYDLSKIISPLKIRLFSLAWGVLIISLIFQFHYEEVFTIINSFLQMEKVDPAIFNAILMNMIILSTGSLLFAMFINYLDGSIKLSRLISEIIDTALLIVVFKYTPLLLAFGIYFGLWHSLKAMNAEFKVLSNKDPDFSLLSFIKSMIPLSTISIAGLIVLILVGLYFNSSISPIMLFVVGISALTLPHAISMDKMYSKLSLKR